MCGMSVRIDNLRAQSTHPRSTQSAHHSGSGSSRLKALIPRTPDACFTHVDFSNKSVSDLIVGTVGDDDIDTMVVPHV